MHPKTPVRGVPHPPALCRGASRQDGQRCIAPLRGAARQPEAALLTASSKHTSPAATPGPSTSHPLPMPAGMPGAHGTAWEAAGNERALCLRAVKGACLPSAPPVLSREGPWLSEGSPCRQGLAHVPLQGAWGTPDGISPGLQWARRHPNPVLGTQLGQQASPPDPRSQSRVPVQSLWALQEGH